MAHCAEIDSKTNIVKRVIVVNDYYNDYYGELTCEQWCQKTFGGVWVKTSYNTRGGKHYKPNSNEVDNGVPLRKNYAGIGYTYDKVRDAFISPKQYPSWVLDEQTCQYKAPKDKPKDDKIYDWNESSLNWIERKTL